jgi:hypothetical protein
MLIQSGEKSIGQKSMRNKAEAAADATNAVVI